jgi:hypothetical protein
MDHGIPTEEVLAERRAANLPICYPVGTPKGRLSNPSSRCPGRNCGRRNNWLVITPSHHRLVNPSSQDGRAAASTVVVVSLWICGRRAHTAWKASGSPPPTTPQAQQQQK